MNKKNSDIHEKQKKVEGIVLDELRKKASERDEFHSKWLKVHAEYDNTRKRMERERDDNQRFANEGILSKLFTIVDHFDMALAAVEKAEDKAAVMDGIRLVQKEFHKVLEDNGVKKIETEGKMFDPNFHEAVYAEVSDKCSEGTILAEIRPGYLLNDRLLRPAQVKVSKSPEGTG